MFGEVGAQMKEMGLAVEFPLMMKIENVVERKKMATFFTLSFIIVWIFLYDSDGF